MRSPRLRSIHSLQLNLKCKVKHLSYPQDNLTDQLLHLHQYLEGQNLKGHRGQQHLLHPDQAPELLQDSPVSPSKVDPYFLTHPDSVNPWPYLCPRQYPNPRPTLTYL